MSSDEIEGAVPAEGMSDFGQMSAMADMGGFGEQPADPFAQAPSSAFDGNVAADENEKADNSEMIMGLPVMLKVVLGSAKMPVATLSKLAKGSVVKLDKVVGDPVDILVNGRLVARGEVVVLNEGTSRFGVVLTQVGGFNASK